MPKKSEGKINFPGIGNLSTDDELIPYDLSTQI